MNLRIALCLAALAAIPAHAADRGGPFAWPDGKKAAVSLAYDDALESQLDHAIPALDRHGFKGSFYLPLAYPVVWKRLDEWRAAAREGHELGNHSLFHQCSASQPDRDWVQPQRDLDTTSAAQMKDQVLLASAMLHAIDGKDRRTYTAPCGDLLAHGENYIALVAPDFVAIKLGGGAVVPDMRTLDLAAVPVDAPVGVSGKDLIAKVEEAARKGTMANFTFHGIGGDFLTVSSEAHEELLRYLDAHRDAYWVAPFVDIMEYVRRQRTSAD